MVKIEWKQPKEVIQRLVARKFPSKVPLTPRQYRSAVSKSSMAPVTRSLRVRLERMPTIKITPKKKASKARPLKKKKKKGRKYKKCKKFGRRDVTVREHTRNVRVCLKH